nr:MAG TPA: hypothetical protein [Caudoviricetes sp.]
MSSKPRILQAQPKISSNFQQALVRLNSERTGLSI